MHKGLLFMALLCLGCCVVQVLPIISVPVTGAAVGYNLYLSNYQNYTFGVFGICDMETGLCSKARIGYPGILGGADYSNPASESSFGVVELPSKARYTISKLLVVHVVGFFFSGILLLVIISLMVVYSYENTPKLRLVDKFRKFPRHLKIPQKNHSGDSSTIAVNERNTNERVAMTDEGFPNSIFNNNNDNSEHKSARKLSFLPQIKIQRQSSHKKKKRDITPYLNLMLMLALFAFLSALLGFLSDILLFIPHLSYLGWLQFYPIFASALLASMTCFMKRSISSRRYLDDNRVYENDDMRMRRSIDFSHWEDDSDSDDGFYVCTNGFYSTYNNEERYHRPRSASSNGGWRRHTPRGEAEGETESIVNGIELANLEYDLTDAVNHRVAI
ncbi:pH-response regulator protein palI/Rim9p [[Candida] anglica]|uniref:PH-response regulator protein palI/Rim9p n=1 Tax=[Candida] anglica TaxID=148631 RepID=A0ABP0EFM7_9ASCO